MTQRTRQRPTSWLLRFSVIFVVGVIAAVGAFFAFSAWEEARARRVLADGEERGLLEDPRDLPELLGDDNGGPLLIAFGTLAEAEQAAWEGQGGDALAVQDRSTSAETDPDWPAQARSFLTAHSESLAVLNEATAKPYRVIAVEGEGWSMTISGVMPLRAGHQLLTVQARLALVERDAVLLESSIEQLLALRTVTHERGTLIELLVHYMMDDSLFDLISLAREQLSAATRERLRAALAEPPPPGLDVALTGEYSAGALWLRTFLGGDDAGLPDLDTGIFTRPLLLRSLRQHLLNLEEMIALARNEETPNLATFDHGGGFFSDQFAPIYGQISTRQSAWHSKRAAALEALAN